jgi:X-X-X-Leu-X-X-Gly heptad repeat protein
MGPYRLRARLGAGGMGQVFLGYSPGGRAVAVKVIHRELAGDQEFRARFRREVAAASAVSGAYTAPVVAAGPDDDPPWLATVYVPGPSLAEAVHTAGPLPSASVWRLAGGLVEALQAVHACGLVHRDLKPANVLLALDGPRMIDFGISRALGKTAMTSTGMIVGTPSYMSPEQAEGGRVGAPSDVFSFGCVIVFAATGTGPFGHGPQASLLYRVVHAAPVITEVPGGLRGLAAGCLAKVPADRPTLDELQAAIAAGRAPDDGDALASFWPVAVTGLIRSHQARLTTELREGPTSPAQAEGAASLTQAAGRPAGTSGRTAPAVGATALVAGSTELAAGSTELAAGSTELAAATTALAGPPRRPLGGRRWRLGPPRLPGPPRPLAHSAGHWLHRTRRPHPSAGNCPGRGDGNGPGGRLRASPACRSSLGGCSRHGPSRHSSAGSTDDKVYALRASDGHPLWAFPTRGAVQSKIAAADGRVYAGSNDASVYALRASDGRPL